MHLRRLPDVLQRVNPDAEMTSDSCVYKTFSDFTLASHFQPTEDTLRIISPLET